MSREGQEERPPQSSTKFTAMTTGLRSSFVRSAPPVRELSELFESAALLTLSRV